jgi:hypothetical protein
VKTPYAQYDVLEKWDSPSFDTKTRGVIASRLHTVPPRRFFSDDEWRLLEAIIARLIPQPNRPDPVPIAAWIDDQLCTGRGEGFRHDNMPPMPIAWRNGLAAIDAEAVSRHATRFTELDAAACDALLHEIELDKVDPPLWAGIPAQRFFIDILLKTVAGIYYSHPAAWSEIGFGGPASPRGYVRLGFDQRDAWEAKEKK